MSKRFSKRMVLSSYEMVTPLGKNVDESFDNALKQQSGIVEISRFDHSDINVHYAGQIPEMNLLETGILNKRELKNWFSPVIGYSMLVANKAVEKSGLVITDNNRHRIATTFSSAIGGIDAILAADQNWNSSRTTPHPFTNVNVCLNLIAGKISMMLGIQGPLYAPVAACATGNVSVITGAMLIEQGFADVVICGAVDFPLIKSVVAAFSSMNGTFNSEKTDDRGYQCPQKTSRPFSVDRKGFLLAEGAACLILTSLEYAIKHNLSVETEIIGSAMNSDGYHYVIPSQETAQICMENAITDAGLSLDQIDLINAHAASTKIGDLNEYKALKSIWKDRLDQTPMCANKSQTGHTMGASSAIELIFSCLSIKHNIIFPTINYIPDPEFPLTNIYDHPVEKQVNTVINNAFGFGGTNGCIVLKKI